MPLTMKTRPIMPMASAPVPFAEPEVKSEAVEPVKEATAVTPVVPTQDVVVNIGGTEIDLQISTKAAVSTTAPKAAINIAVINESTKVTDAEVQAMVAALQIQVDRDFFPIWGISANLGFYAKGQAPKTYWQLIMLDNSDQAGALGYHELTSSGLPLAKAFVESDLQYGLSWTVTASHELLEFLVDPLCNLSVFNQNSTDNSGTLYAYEVCDSCEDDAWSYEIDGVKVSDFVTPHWFEGWRTAGSAKFDFKGHINMPFEILSGGYIGYINIGTNAGWQQETAQTLPAQKMVAPVGSRREKRLNPKRKRLST